MNIEYYGNGILFYAPPNSEKGKNFSFVLADGYSYENITVRASQNVTSFMYPEGPVSVNSSYNFPPVASHSPNTISFTIRDLTSKTLLFITINKFGQIPDSHYFVKNNIFEPILITGDDGNEYNVIPSDQFK